ncbi:alkaline phosphatase [Halalkalibacterium halodurans]|uniref:alkaline phosphatase n=1 Tax=Halalkalibacterium halodurans TaxID=86665 RepID=UPI002E1FB044|nr:alkaline phosphatase [Halalkalibacterium halodurans]
MKHRVHVTVLLFVMIVLILPAETVFASFVQEGTITPDSEQVKNIIYMIPDGYSASYATNYRIYKGEEEPIWDPHLVGMVKTHSADSWVTDSAAAGTALATGTKTSNGTIGMSTEGEELESILQAAGKHKKGTGIVVTTRLTHATPAAFVASVPLRIDEAKIAPQMIGQVDVLLGGGKKMFVPEAEGGMQNSRHLLNEAEDAGYALIETKEELQNVNSAKVLGLFSEGALAPELDRQGTQEPSLAEMTEVALHTLKQNPNGFFLMVEGSQIDWAGHDNDAAWAMKDIEAFEEAVSVAFDFAEKDGNTLVVVVGDHDTGGLSVGAYGQYKAKPDMLKQVKATGKFIASQVNKRRTNLADVMKTYTGFELTKKELKQIKKADHLTNAINQVISRRALIGWTTPVHTGTDIPIYAFGPCSDRLHGLLDNTDIPLILADVMDLEWEKAS